MIKLENVSYLDKLKNITYYFQKESITTITGFEGKTLLTYLLMGLEKPTMGKVYTNNLKIGYVFEKPMEAFFNVSVYDEISFGLKKDNYSKEQVDKKVKEALNLVNLSLDYLDKNPFDLSSGEMEKLALASVLVSDPEVIIIDKPTVYLDNSELNYLLNLLKKLKLEYHKTIILVSNNAEFYYKISDRILFLKDGKIFFEANKKKVIENSYKLIENGFNLPLSLQFIYLLNKKKGYKLKYILSLQDIVKRLELYVK